MINFSNLIFVVFLVCFYNLLYAQVKYSQGLFETDEEFTERVIQEFSPKIDNIKKCVFSPHFITNDNRVGGSSY
jgi:hypothetical protein